jgi:hypothetical protein
VANAQSQSSFPLTSSNDSVCAQKVLLNDFRVSAAACFAAVRSRGATLHADDSLVDDFPSANLSFAPMLPAHAQPKDLAS